MKNEHTGMKLSVRKDSSQDSTAAATQFPKESFRRVKKQKNEEKEKEGKEKRRWEKR